MSRLSLKDAWFLFLALIITAVILLGTSLPGENRLMYSLQDSGHFLIFTLLTLAAVWPFRNMSYRMIWPVMFLVLMFGVLMEAVQSFIGREPSLYDLLMDMLGIAAGAILYTGFVRHSFPPYRAVAIVIALSLIALSQPLYWFIVYQVRADHFPRLVEMDNYFSRALIEGSGGGDVRHVDLPVDWLLPTELDIDSCVHVSLREGRWPGMDMQEPAADWRGYDHLELQIYSDQLDELPLTLRIHDQSHNRQFEDRYNRKLLIQPGYNHFLLPLPEVKEAPRTRMMNMAAISDVMIFATPKHLGKGFCLLSVGLR
ncbi:MAG: VanZ family protein [Candidatus Thiodiazotropha endolucinida]